MSFLSCRRHRTTGFQASVQYTNIFFLDEDVKIALHILCFLDIQMADVGLTEAYEGSGYKFEIWFRRRSLGDNYILQAPNSDVRHQWTKEISRVLWNQALKNRGRRQRTLIPHKKLIISRYVIVTFCCQKHNFVDFWQGSNTPMLEGDTCIPLFSDIVKF